MTRPVIVVMIHMLLSGCSGGGNPDNGSNPPALQKATITRVGARYHLESSLSLVTYTSSIMEDVLFLAYLIYDEEGIGEFFQEYDCDNPGGSFRAYGNLSDRTGEIVMSFQICINDINEVATDGIMRTTVNEADSLFILTDYTVSFESYIKSSTTDTTRQSMEDTIEVWELSDTTQVASIDMRTTNLNTDEYFEINGLKLYGDTPAGLSPTWNQTRVVDQINHSTMAMDAVG